MKKLVAILLALTLLSGCAAAMAEPVSLRYAEVNPIDDTTIVGSIAAFFKKTVEEISGGEVLIDAQGSGVLGSEQQVLDGILGGDDSVDISRISAFALSSFGCSKATLLSLPYTFVSRDHFWAFANSDLAKEFLNEPQEIGLPLRGICYGEEGFRHFFTKAEVKDIEGLKNMKIRVSDDPVMTGLVKGLGANPAVVSFTELYSALQTGVVDAAEQPAANYRSNRFHEVAPYLLLDGHTLGAIQLVITDAGWAKLNEQQQGWILEAGKLTQEYCQKISAEKEAAVFEMLKSEGCTIVEVADKAPWQAACKPVLDQYTAQYPELYQQILDLQ